MRCTGAVDRRLHRAPRRVFVGDPVHTPIQIGRLGDCCAFDLDAEQACSSRRVVLAAAGTNATVLPARFAGPGAASVATGANTEPALGARADRPPL